MVGWPAPQNAPKDTRTSKDSFLRDRYLSVENRRNRRLIERLTRIFVQRPQNAIFAYSRHEIARHVIHSSLQHGAHLSQIPVVVIVRND